MVLFLKSALYFGISSLLQSDCIFAILLFDRRLIASDVGIIIVIGQIQGFRKGLTGQVPHQFELHGILRIMKMDK